MKKKEKNKTIQSMEEKGLNNTANGREGQNNTADGGDRGGDQEREIEKMKDKAEVESMKVVVEEKEEEEDDSGGLTTSTIQM